MGVLDKLFSGGEENVIREASEIVRIAIKANTELLGRVRKMDSDMGEIKRLEKESDKKVFAMQNMVSSGAVSPNIIDDMLRLIDLEDNIVDAIYNLARELARYRMPDKRMGDMLQKKIIESLELTDVALKALEKMQSTQDTEQMKRYRKKIEDLEERGDEIKDTLLDYTYTDNIDFKSFNHISEAAHKADNILDNCEDSADMYLSIMLSIIT